MLYLIVGLIILACLILWAVILIQNPKGGGLSSNMGGGSVTNLIGAKKSVDFVEKATWGVSLAILVLVLVSTMAIPTGNNTADSDSDVRKAAQSSPSVQETIGQPAQDGGDAPLMDLNNQLDGGSDGDGSGSGEDGTL